MGKTTLSRSVQNAEYFNCDLPEVADQLEQPARFFAARGKPRIILDEVHQLSDPARLLKIAADEYPRLQVLATGSSTLAATDKFSDSLTGRKREVHLPPVLALELLDFGVPDLDRRLLHGGMPQQLLASELDRSFFSEWLDSYFSRDVRELFRVEKRAGFLALVESLLRQSGGLLEITSMSRATGLSRPTVMSYLDVLEITHVVTRLRPWSGGRNDRDLVRIPKAYAFDTGFVCHARGIRDLRADDRGPLLEHLVLDTLRSIHGAPRVHYWRDKSRREIDFIIPRDRDNVDAIEVKWNSNAFDPTSLRAFRQYYPAGRNWVVSAQRAKPFEKSVADLVVTFVGIEDLRNQLSAIS